MEYIGIKNEKIKIDIKNKELKEILRYEGDIPIFPAYLSGEYYYGEKYSDILSPIDLSIIAKIPRLDQNKVFESIDKIYKEGRMKVRNIPIVRRLEILNNLKNLIEKYKEDIANILIANIGKTYKQAIGEIDSTIERIDLAYIDLRKMYGEYYDGEISNSNLETEGIVKREPLGIVLIISPFNYPLFDTIDKLVPAFLSGNAFIIKPPSADPLPILILSKLLELSGFPKESFSIITVPGKEMNNIIKDKRISSIAFTGSTETGEEIIKNAGIKEYIMELGGGDPAIVLEDADIEDTINNIVTGIISFSGQRCDSIKLILVEEKIYDKIKEKLIDKMKNIKIGDPRLDVDMGPVIDVKTVDEFEYAIKDALNNGGKILIGGKRLDKNYIEPTIIEIDKDKVKDLYLYNKEVFLSIALLVKVSNIEEAIEIANGRRYGLDLAIFGKDINKIRKIIESSDVGAVYINIYPKHGIGYYPYGGVKDSGIGRTGLGYAIERLTRYKTIVYNYKGKGIWMF